MEGKEEGTMVTGRQAGLLMTIRPSYDEHFLTLTSLEGDQIHVNFRDDIRLDYVIYSRVWRQNVQGVDCGDEVADWLSRILFNNTSQVRLMYCGHVSWNRTANKPKYFEFPQFNLTDKIYYADTTPFMIANHNSLADLNNKCSENMLMENFRPNIVVKGPRPFDEDQWKYIKIGKVIFRVTKPCERCVITCIDLNTGQRRKEPIQTLVQYRLLKEPKDLSKIWSRSPIFGINCCIDKCGPISLGEKVFIVRDKNQWNINKG